MITRTSTSPLGWVTTVGDIRAAMNGVPDEASVRIDTERGDRPWESDTQSITFTWEEEPIAQHEETVGVQLDGQTFLG